MTYGINIFVEFGKIIITPSRKACTLRLKMYRPQQKKKTKTKTKTKQQKQNKTKQTNNNKKPYTQNIVFLKTVSG